MSILGHGCPPLNGICHRYVKYQFCLLTFNVDLDLEPILRKLLHDTSTQNGEEIMLRKRSVGTFDLQL